jgi:hypothetical protein
MTPSILQKFVDGEFDIIPILKPISDLAKEIELEGGEIIIGGERFYDTDDVYIDSLNYEKLTWFFERHYDVFGLIEKGLAEDINTKYD